MEMNINHVCREPAFSILRFSSFPLLSQAFCSPPKLALPTSSWASLRLISASVPGKKGPKFKSPISTQSITLTPSLSQKTMSNCPCLRTLCISSWCWGLGVTGQGVGRIGVPEASLLGLEASPSGVFLLSPLWSVCASNSSTKPWLSTHPSGHLN